MGAWLSYGLGSENQNLPAFVVLLSQAHAITTDQPLFSRLWGSGFLPSSYQGVRFRAGSAPVLYPRRSAGHHAARRGGRCSTRSAKLNAMQHEALRRSGDRDADRAVRDGLPDADVSAGADGSLEGTGLGLRAVRAGVAQARHVRRATASWRGAWPSATSASSSSIIAAGISTATCRATSRCSARAPTSRPRRSITDLKQRGLLDDTLVIWGGEFGRTVFSQGKLTDVELRPRPPSAQLLHVDGGRRHEARRGRRRDRRLQLQHRLGSGVACTTCRRRSCTCWASITRRLTYRFQGRDFRLTDVHGEVAKKLLA